MAELTRRYVVMSMATEAPFDQADPESVFVLKPWKDPAALRALAAYADNCYPELARDLAAWIAAIERGPVVRGDVGRRNEAHLRQAGMPRRRPALASATKASARKTKVSRRGPKTSGRATKSARRATRPRRRRR